MLPDGNDCAQQDNERQGRSGSRPTHGVCIAPQPFAAAFANRAIGGVTKRQLVLIAAKILNQLRCRRITTLLVTFQTMADDRRQSWTHARIDSQDRWRS